MTIPSRLPGITYGPLPVTTSAAAALALPPRLVVIHDTSNDASAAAEARYASIRPLSGATSAHFYIDASGPLGSLPLNKQAWAAYGYANGHGWHLEMCGYNAGTAKAVPASTVAMTAALVRQLCDLAGIPKVKLSPAEVAAGKRGICGHRDITIGLNVGTHDDPGEAFDWPAFIAAVNGDDDMPLTSQDLVAIWTHDLLDGTGTDPAYKVLNRAAADAAAARDAVVALNAKVGAISAVDPAVVAAALAANTDFVSALASAIAETVGDREAAADRARADVLDGQ
jgi:hypothetical protein